MTTLIDPWMLLHSPQHSKGVTVRPIQPSDVLLLEEMHQRLSPESVYSRYLQPRVPTLAELLALCCLDPAKGAGFVASAADDSLTDEALIGEGIIVGLAYYVREARAPEPTAEPGILVEDRFQAYGIGRRLWQTLQRHAQMAGIRWLRAWSHPGNQRLAQLVRGGGAPHTAQIRYGLSEYLIDLGEQPNLTPKVLLGQNSDVTSIDSRYSVDNRLLRN